MRLANKEFVGTMLVVVRAAVLVFGTLAVALARQGGVVSLSEEFLHHTMIFDFFDFIHLGSKKQKTKQDTIG